MIRQVLENRRKAGRQTQGRDAPFVAVRDQTCNVEPIPINLEGIQENVVFGR